MNPEAKLRRGGLPEEAVAAFRALYDQLVAGASGTLPDAELEPVRELPTLAQLPRPAALGWLGKAAVIKLNGGLGTSMGLDPISFQDFRRWRYYNTNNLWLDLEALTAVPDLPLIVNRKTVDPSDPDSRPVIQTETAMGAAIGVFSGSRALCVPRSRFVPVKTTDDLLALRSDVYRLLADGRVEGVAEPPYIALDPSYFKRIADFEARFPHGAPSLRECRRFVVRGDVSFGRGVVAHGRVEVCADVPDDTILSGVYRPAVETLR